VQPGNIVGAIANEANLDGSQINGIRIQDDHTLVRLPEGLPESLLSRLQRVRVRGQMLAIKAVSGDDADSATSDAGEDRPPRRFHKPKPHHAKGAQSFKSKSNKYVRPAG
jgi:ATP-dependent RNA helicase DeaD